MPALETAIPDKKLNGSAVSASGDAPHEVIELSGEDEETAQSDKTQDDTSEASSRKNRVSLQ